MSDFRALAAVTLALRDLLQAAVAPIGQAFVTTHRPERPPGDQSMPIVNIFLYQVAPNAAWRNSDVPTRRADGSFIQRPRTALDLYYILTFWGDEKEQVPQLLLGLTAAALTATPAPLAPPGRVTLPGGEFSPRAEFIEPPGPPAMVPIALTLDELSKLWTMFQIPYGLSAVYKASAVLIDSDVPVPPPALPVLRIPIWPVPAGRPEIERIEPPALDDAPGAGFTIYGDNLSGPGTTVRIGARPATPSKMSPGALTVALPDGLRIGTVGVQVVRAEAPAAHWIVESNPFALLLRPRVSGAPSYAAEAPAGSSAPSPAIYVPVSPAAAPGQVAQLYLDESDPPADRPARGYSVAIGALREMTTLLAFPAAGVAAGSYLVRIVIDGATSLLAIDTDPASPTYGRYASPLVSVPQTDASAEGAP